MNKENKLIEGSFRHEVIALAKKVMKKNNLTQEEVAEAMNTQQASISKFLNGQTSISLDWAERFFKSCGYEIKLNLNLELQKAEEN